MVQISRSLLDGLTDLRFLIADTTAGRKVFRHLLTEMKVKSTQISMSSNLQETLEDMEKNRPHVIFADFSIEPGMMPKLLEIQKEFLQEEDVRAFFLAASKEECATINISREEGFDDVFIKPFSYGQILESFVQVMNEKFNPSPYVIEILAGKYLLARGNLEDALTSFKAAEMIERDHPRAKALQGRTLMKMGRMDQAITAFKSALRNDPSHYESQLGLLEILNARGDYVQAYQISKRLSADHTLPLRMIPDLVRLSIQNKRFDDILEYDKLLETTRNTDPDVAINVATALVIAGIHYVTTGKVPEGVASFRRAEGLTPANVSIHTRIFSALSQNKLNKEIDAMLQRLSKDVMNSTEFRLARFEHIDRYGDPLDSISEGIHLLRSGIKTPQVHRAVIERSIQVKRSPSVIADLIHNAILDCPEEEENFLSLMPTKS